MVISYKYSKSPVEPKETVEHAAARVVEGFAVQRDCHQT